MPTKAIEALCFEMVGGRLSGVGSVIIEDAWAMPVLGEHFVKVLQCKVTGGISCSVPAQTLQFFPAALRGKASANLIALRWLLRTDASWVDHQRSRVQVVKASIAPSEFSSRSAEVDQLIQDLNERICFGVRVVKVFSRRELISMNLRGAVWSGVETDLAGVTPQQMANFRFGHDKKTLLHIAASRHHVRLVGLLLAGIEADVQTTRGLTPLMMAVMKRSHCSKTGAEAKLQVIKALLLAGADPLAVTALVRLRCSIRCLESAFSLSVVTEAARTGSLSVPLLLLGGATTPRKLQFWPSIIRRFITKRDAAMCLLIGIGRTIPTPLRGAGQSTSLPSLFGSLIALVGGADGFYAACCQSTLSPCADFTYVPDAKALEDEHFSDRVLFSELKSSGSLMHADLEALKMASTHLACPSFISKQATVWSAIVSLQRPGLFDLHV